MSDKRENFRKLRKKVEDIFRNAPGCHDIEHTLRVLHNARLIAKSEKISDIAVVEAAALLHDIARPEEFDSGGKICHAIRGAEKSVKVLIECGFRDPDFIKKVSECVRKHRFRLRGPNKPDSIEEKIIYDADKLDSIGAVGVGRAFHFAGRLGAKLHNSKAVALSSPSYGNEDSAYREYLVKLRKVRKRMQTRAGAALAERRHKFMRRFFEELNFEIYGKK